jgi:hypothetical protein
VHGYAHLTIAGRLDPCAGLGGREAFVAATLRPVLDSVVRGSVPARKTRPKSKTP